MESPVAPMYGTQNVNNCIVQATEWWTNVVVTEHVQAILAMHTRQKWKEYSLYIFRDHAIVFLRKIWTGLSVGFMPVHEKGLRT